MPSPFPGMDPFIEGYEWDDFHARMMTGLSDTLVPQLRPRYAVRTERRVYVEHPFDDPDLIPPDLTIYRDMPGPPRCDVTTAESAVLEPVERTLPAPVEVQQQYIVIRRLDTHEVVSIIELLTPSNKRSEGEGRAEYLAKRDDVLQSRTNLIEIDLLRGGLRLPTVEPLPPGDFYAFVCRTQRRYRADVYAWTLSHSLPTIKIPLQQGEPELQLDLQAVFNEVYERAGYDYSIHYQRPVKPPIDDDTALWIQYVLGTVRVN